MKIIYLLLFIFFSCSLVGQADLLERNGSNYLFKGKSYKYNELAPIYSAHQESLDLYISGRKNKKNANIIAIIGLVPTIPGIIMTQSDGSIATLIYGVLLIAGGIVIELIGLIPRAIGGRKIRDARNGFNNEMLKRHGYKSDTSLSFGSTKQGLGLVMTF